jgi:phage terminase large subunit
MRTFSIYITEDSINIMSEFKKYKWATDPDGKELSPSRPIDMYNHCADSIRYALTRAMTKKVTMI